MRTIMLDLSDTGALVAEYDSTISQGGLRIVSADKLKVREEVLVDVLFPDGETLSVLGRVAAPIPGRPGEFAVKLKEGNVSRQVVSKARIHAHAAAKDSSRPRIDESTPPLAPVKPTKPPSQEELAARQKQLERAYRQMVPSKPTETQTLRSGKKDGNDKWLTPPVEDVRKLSVKQRKQRAISGGPNERHVLFHDADTSLQVWALKNPSLSLPEALRFSAHADLTVEAIRFLATNKRWSQEIDIVRNLGVNPATPPDAVLRMLRGLPPETLDELLADPQVKDRFSELLRPGGAPPRG